MSKIGYTTRTIVENFLGKQFPEISDSEFDIYIAGAEKYINNFTGYNAQTSVSGMLTQTIEAEKSIGKVDNYGNMVISLRHPPVHFDANRNPLVSRINYNQGAINIDLQMTDGTTGAKNTVVEVSENRKKVYYPHLYFLPAISSLTPSAKINLYNLRDVRFWVDIWYTGGYDETPEDVQMACNYLVSEFVMRRTNPMFLSNITQGMMTMGYQSNQSKKGHLISPQMQIANQLLQSYVLHTF